MFNSLKSEEFKDLYKNGRAVKSKTFKLFYKQCDAVKIGIVVSKKLGSAVTRNRIKRRTKEAVKSAIIEGNATGKFAMIPYTAAEKIKHSDLIKEVIIAIKRI